MSKLHEKFEKNDPILNISINNIWPMLVAAVMFIVGYVSTQSDLKYLRRDFDNYQTQSSQQIAALSNKIDALSMRSSALNEQVPAVKGVATVSGSLKRPILTPTLTPTPTKRPSPTFTPTPTKLPTPTVRRLLPTFTPTP